MYCLRYGLAFLLALSVGVSAQPAPGPCEDVLAEAEQRYQEQDYGSVEPYVIECVYRPGVTERQLQEAYRLLALAYIRQDLLADAQLTIVKLFGVDYAYEPDPVTDPPFYVALVSAVKEQLRVEVGRADLPAVPSEVDEAPASASAASGGDAAYEPVVVTLAEPEPGPSMAAPRPPIDVNTATVDQLESLPGIGPALAGRIVAYRTDYGPFARPEDVQNVRGIGPRTTESLLPLITAGTETPPTRVEASPPPETSDGAATAEPDLGDEAPPASPSTASGRLNLNTATVEELDALPGIGPILAQRIVESRERDGPFRSVEAVTRVRGLGSVKLAGFRDYVQIGD